MKRREGMLSLLAAGVLLALLSVFALELSNTQAKSKADVVARVHERGVLAAALIDSLFQTVAEQIPQDTRTYGARVVPQSVMNAARQTNAFAVLVDPAGHVLAYSRGFTPQARADLKFSAALALVRAGHAYGLGNILPYGRTGVINLAVQFPTRYGPRILLTGFPPITLGSFIGADLKEIPGVAGAHNYLIDGNDAVIASTYAARPTGHVFDTAAQVATLGRSSGDVSGHYYVIVPLANSTERIVLSSPDGPLFASVSGLHKWVPWLIFIAFALVSVLAMALASRVLRAADEARSANARLAGLNTQLEDANATLERRADELVRSNSELEQFASIASHDLQEPLRKVRTFTQQLRVIDGENLSEKGSDYLVRANAAAERMQRLIEDLLKFSRVATHGRPFEMVDLGAVADEVLQDLELQVSRTGAVVHVGELPTISADPLQMRQLLQNLVSNALKFHRSDVTPEVTVEATVSNGSFSLTVRDNGIGFEPQYNHRIFRVFERLHGRSEYPGTGIGLALCRKIADRHGGTIEADGEPGVGTTITVTLPVNQPQSAIVAAEADNGSAPRGEEAHVTV